MLRALLFLISLSIAGPMAAQVPTGTIAGTVTDQVGAVLPNVTITITNRGTGAARVLLSGADGGFLVPSLPAGSYDVLFVADGFQPIMSPADVRTGATTTVTVGLELGTRTETVTVTGVTTSVDLATNRVQGLVGRTQIDNLPLNGRSFMNLAQLQPGVTVNPGNPAQFNAQFNVSVLGGPASRTAITVDGGNVRNPIEGGPGQNFSQEVVQEFQISTANFDLSTGIAAFGAINVVTRSGSNDVRGAVYYYHRDDNLSAYPSLARTTLVDKPEFSRRQSGFVLGGPIKKDRAHFFANYERTDQEGVYVVQPDLPSVAAFGTLAPAPYDSNTLSGRVDYSMSARHSLFGRYSHDGNTNSGPFGTPVPPSNFVSNKNFVDQQLLGITSVLGPTLVNDFRFSHMYWRNRNSPAQCEGDINANCIGFGGPEIFYLNSVNFTLGNNFNSPQGRDLHRIPISNNTTWQKGRHQVKFGGTWEHVDAVGYWGFFDPARVFLLSPEFLANISPALPALFGLPDGKIRSQADLLRLPVVAFLLGIGDRSQPSYRLDNARGNDRYHLYVQDSWQASDALTINLGLGWQHESNVLNYDLPKPAYLAPVYGSDLRATQKEYKNFSPAGGFAWKVGQGRPTVIRGGAGIYYDTQLGWWRLGERAVIGGSGRQFIGNAAVINPLSGQPFSTAFLNSLAYNYGTFLQQLPALRAQQDAKYPGTGDQPQILLSKQATALGALYPREFPTTRANHFNLGFQRELGPSMVVQADLVYRKMLHGTPGGFFGTSVDFNRFNAINGPVIPRCTAANASDPNAQCSSGSINFWWPGAEAEYTGLLMRVDKRFSNRYQWSVSYALQDSQSIRDVNQNLDDYFATYGPDLPRHNLTVSGVVEIPGGFQISVLSTFLSRFPVAPVIAGFDSSGTNVSSSGYTPLLGILGKGYAGFLSKKDLESLVSEYNSTHAGTLTPAGRAGISANQRFPVVTLPSTYTLGDVFTSQDVRVTKSFRFGTDVDLRLIGEVFNLLNVSNLTNYSFNLVVPSTFGKANQRVGQTFGSGGPRAFQVAARLGF
ncbi:MAG: carboxypeptidase regulatory-like domain-containing protein [Acidobacteriota bacterium]